MLDKICNRQQTDTKGAEQPFGVAMRYANFGKRRKESRQSTKHKKKIIINALWVLILAAGSNYVCELPFAATMPRFTHKSRTIMILSCVCLSRPFILVPS